MTVTTICTTFVICGKELCFRVCHWEGSGKLRGLEINWYAPAFGFRVSYLVKAQIPHSRTQKLYLVTGKKLA